MAFSDLNVFFQISIFDRICFVVTGESNRCLRPNFQLYSHAFLWVVGGGAGGGGAEGLVVLGQFATMLIYKDIISGLFWRNVSSVNVRPTVNLVRTTSIVPPSFVGITLADVSGAAM